MDISANVLLCFISHRVPRRPLTSSFFFLSGVFCITGAVLKFFSVSNEAYIALSFLGKMAISLVYAMMYLLTGELYYRALRTSVHFTILRKLKIFENLNKANCLQVEWICRLYHNSQIDSYILTFYN